VPLCADTCVVSEITPPHPHRRESGLILRSAAAAFAYAGIVLGIAGFAYVTDTWILFAFVPVLALVALVLALVASGLVGWKLRSRPVAWGVIVAGGAACCFALALLGRHVSEDHRRHEQFVRSIDALGGMHGASRGVSFDIRPVGGDRRVEMHLGLTGVKLRSRLEHWDVHCFLGELHTYFGGANAVRRTPSGATLERTNSNPMPTASLEHPAPYCTLEVWYALGGDEDFSAWAPLSR
jgi:hypothetical protein